MKNVVTSALALVACVTLPGLAAAQNTVKLLDPVAIAQSTIPGGLVPPGEAVEFASKQLYLQCDAGATALVVGPYPNSGLIVDDYIWVQGPTDQITQYCSPESCFSDTTGDPLLYLGQPADAAYLPVDPVDVSASLVPGLGLYTFSLTDRGYSYASTELSLLTTCAIKDKVCHYDSGKKAYKTLTVGAAAIPAHLTKHAGDFLGACEDR
jgi:hypothetical protein